MNDATVALYDALQACRAQWVHSVNAPQCIAALALADRTLDAKLRHLEEFETAADFAQAMEPSTVLELRGPAAEQAWAEATRPGEL